MVIIRLENLPMEEIFKTTLESPKTELPGPKNGEN